MPRLELTDEEALELGEALTAQLHVMRAELSAADIRQARHDLRERLDRLEQIAARVARASASEEDTTDRWAPAD